MVYKDLLTGDELLSESLLLNRVLKAPKTDPSLYWGKRKSQTHRHEDSKLIPEAEAHLNKFSNDGSFMLSKQKSESVETKKDGEGTLPNMESLSVNQLAAKALQFRLKEKLEEAQKLTEETERLKAKQADSSKEQHYIRAARYPIKDTRKNEDDNTDMHLARSIMQNKQYKTSNQAADDEYDYGDAPTKKSRKRERSNVLERESPVKRILTQQERCLFCFENPKRLKHLVVSIANFTYLMLPQHQPLVPGHCCILTMQHEAASRSVDDNVWGEIRNFKKCLIMMFAKAGKDVVFLETVIGLSQQRRHCLIECIPIPPEIAKQGPLYFKKAIDEAESEWSEHKLIDTSVKGLRNSIPESFPYFHVEFGLDKGFAHGIGDEKKFNSNLGLNVIRGMLELPEEDMYRRTRNESVENQKKAAEWELYVAEQTAMFADALNHRVGPHHQPRRQSQSPSSLLEPSSSPDPSESLSEMSELPPEMPQYPQCSACGARGFHFHWCTRPGNPCYREPYQLVPSSDYFQICGNDGHFAPICPTAVPGPRMPDPGPSRASIPGPHRARSSRPDPGPTGPLFVPSVACQLCGDEGHLAPACPRRRAVCQLCNRRGHTARFCPMAEPYHIAAPPRNTHPQHPSGTPASGFFCEPYCRLCGAFRACWRR